MRRLAASSPDRCPFHGSLHVRTPCWQTYAFIERHDDVRPEAGLDLDGLLRGNVMQHPIEMRLKGHALVRHLSDLGKTEDLKPPLSVRIALGQDANACTPPSSRTTDTPGRR